MQSDINVAIKILLNQITTGMKSEDAMRFTQAATNLANAAVTLSNIN